MGVADRLPVTGRAVHLDLAGVRRLGGIVGDIQAVVVVGPAIDVFAGAERFRRTGELRFQRFRIGEVFLEGLDPPFERLARDRAGAELMVALLVEEHTAAVPGHLVPGARQLLEPDAGDPVLWIAGVGLEQLPGTWYQMTWNRGGMFFDKQGNHMLGAGSIARETLKWWANTFEKGLDIADPELLKVQFTTSPRRSAPARTSIAGPNHHYGLNIVNDPAQSPIAGKVKVLGSPGDGKTIGDAHVYFLSPPTANKEWAWKLLQYLGGKTKDGNYTQAISLAKDAMLGSGYSR